MRRFNLVQRFSILSLLCIFSITLTGSLIISNYWKNTIIEREGILTAEFLRLTAKEHYSLDDFTTEGLSGNSVQFKIFLKELRSIPEIVRIKIYNKEGRIIWSDEKNLIGQIFKDNRQVEQALQGETVTSLGAPYKREHLYEQTYDKIMEVYVPIFSKGSREVIGVIETYKQPVSLFINIRKAQKLVWIMATLGGSSLYLGLFSIVYNSHKNQIKLERDIRESHQRYMDLIENSPEMIHQINDKRVFLHVNKTELDRLGFSIEEMMRMKLEDLAPKEHKDELIEHFNRVLFSGESTVVTVFKTKQGEAIEVEINETGFFDQKTNKLIQTRAFIRDITQRKEAEKEILYINKYYETILGNMHSYVRVISSEKIVEFENYLIIKDFGQNLGNKCNAFWKYDGPCKDCIVESVISTGNTQTKEEMTSEGRFYSLTSFPLKNRDGSFSAIEVISEITDRKRLEKEIIQQEKMAGLGLLATGLAHEIGNPISIIAGTVQFCLQKLKPGGPLKKHLEVIRRNVSAADKTIKQLLRFAKPAENNTIDVNLIELLKETCAIVASECIQRGIVITENYPAEIPYIFADRTNLRQVFMNILLNSIEAISNGGEITIALEADIEERRVSILFLDTGPGIPPEHLDHIFSPFFTTKEQGTGLGLSICQRVVESHGGKISARNLPHKGAEIVVSLPAKWERY